MAAHFSPGYGYQNGQMAEQAWPARRGRPRPGRARVLRRPPGMKSGLQKGEKQSRRDKNAGCHPRTLFRVYGAVKIVRCSYFCSAAIVRVGSPFLDTLPRGERRSLARAHCAALLHCPLGEKISNEINPRGERGHPSSKIASSFATFRAARCGGNVFERREGDAHSSVRPSILLSPLFSS